MATPERSQADAHALRKIPQKSIPGSASEPTNLAAALSMTTLDKIVYGSDCAVPCTTETTMDANLDALFHQTGLTGDQLSFSTITP
jgi:6-methylsalicylate decarboxylase